MSWNSLASNQMVSFTDASGSGFSLNSGQSHVTSNKCMTKDEALTKYNLDATYMSAYASNQLVPKGVWVAGASGTGTVTIFNYLNSGGTELFIDGDGQFPVSGFGNISTYTVNAGSNIYVVGDGFGTFVSVNVTINGSLFAVYQGTPATTDNFTVVAGNDYWFESFE
jgi:hypothetical protein